MRVIDINRVAEIIKNYAPQNDKSCKSIEQLLSESSFELPNDRNREYYMRLHGEQKLQGNQHAKPLRWRAKQNGIYYLVNTSMDIIEVRDYRTPLDDDHYNCGNYFRTKAEAKEIAVKFADALVEKLKGE